MEKNDLRNFPAQIVLCLSFRKGENCVLTEFTIFLHSTFRENNCGASAKAGDPAEKIRREGYVDSQREVLFPIRKQHNIPTETANYPARQRVLKTQFDTCALSAVHPENLL